MCWNLEGKGKNSVNKFSFRYPRIGMTKKEEFHFKKGDMASQTWQSKFTSVNVERG
jgi:hypothetical protein